MDLLSMLMSGMGGGGGISGGPPVQGGQTGAFNPMQMLGGGGAKGAGGGAQGLQMMGALMKGMSPPPKSPALAKSKGGISGGPNSVYFRGYKTTEPTNSPGAAMGNTLSGMGDIGVADQEKTANQGVNQQIMAYMMAQMAGKGGAQPTVSATSPSGAPPDINVASTWPAQTPASDTTPIGVGTQRQWGVGMGR